MSIDDVKDVACQSERGASRRPVVGEDFQRSKGDKTSVQCYKTQIHAHTILLSYCSS
jgi:hypothetical protein